MLRKASKWIIYILLGLAGLALLSIGIFYLKYELGSRSVLDKLGPKAPSLNEEGFSFRDLNKNGKLDPYEDARLPVNIRIDDLLGQMTLEEKAAQMFQPFISVGEDGNVVKFPGLLSFETNYDLVVKKKLRHFSIPGIPDAPNFAKWHNAIQELAERGRLGIPVTLSSDPRHGYNENDNFGFSLANRKLSAWPEPLGLAATRDSSLVAEFGRIASQEYRALGIRAALHPMADLATEPRWGRIMGTFGEDAALSAQLTTAYIKGFQGDSLGPESVSCMTKHFTGGGPQHEGWDAHFPYGKYQAYPGENFDYHLIPFKAAIQAGTGQMMPYYGIPMEQADENVGFAFNKKFMTTLLRDSLGFDGVLCSDWAILEDFSIAGITFIKGKYWGVQSLTVRKRILKGIEAGLDQFGGNIFPSKIVSLVSDGEVKMHRIDQSVRRLLKQKFLMGLFDDPYVDLQQVEGTVGKDSFMEKGRFAQRKSIVLLKNGKTEASEKLLPLSSETKIFLENVDPSIASKYGKVVNEPEQADVAIIRIKAPYGPPQSNDFLEQFIHQGDLDVKEPEKGRLLEMMNTVPTILSIYLERPAVIPQLARTSGALLAEFGAQDEALLDIIFGKFSPQGKLPIEMPSSMEAVKKQFEDLPYDSEDPLFEFGHGLTYD